MAYSTEYRIFQSLIFWSNTFNSKSIGISRETYCLFRNGTISSPFWRDSSWWPWESCSAAASLCWCWGADPRSRRRPSWSWGTRGWSPRSCPWWTRASRTAWCCSSASCSQRGRRGRAWEWRAGHGTPADLRWQVRLKNSITILFSPPISMLIRIKI